MHRRKRQRHSITSSARASSAERDGSSGANIQMGPLLWRNRQETRSAADPADHVIVVGGFADLIPLILLVAERGHRIIQLLEFCIFR
jgi:hypothetical protein